MPRSNKRKDITPNEPHPKRQEKPQEQATGFLQSLTSFVRTSTNTDLIRATSTMSLNSTSSRLSVDRSKLMSATNFGKMRDMIEVQVVTVNDQPLKTNISRDFAYNKIYKQGLKLNQANFHGIQMQWRSCPLVEIRLKEPIDVDKLPPFFIITVNDETENHLRYFCKVLGVRDSVQSDREQREENPDDPWTRWVTVEGTGYAQKEEIFEAWLLRYGELLTDYEEEVVEIIDEDPGSGEEATIASGTGRFNVKMKIIEHIPQYLPVNGKKVKVYYKGIEKMCTNCYKTGHIKGGCQNEKVNWISYVTKFIEENQDVPPRLFGRWLRVTKSYQQAQATEQIQHRQNLATSERIQNESRMNRNEKARTEPSRSSQRLQESRK